MLSLENVWLLGDQIIGLDWQWREDSAIFAIQSILSVRYPVAP
jgi:hypothetical protein